MSKQANSQAVEVKSTPVEVKSEAEVKAPAGPTMVSLQKGDRTKSVEVGSELYAMMLEAGYHEPSQRFIAEVEFTPIVPMLSKTGSLVHLGSVQLKCGQSLTFGSNGNEITVSQSAISIGKVKQPVRVWITKANAADAGITPIAYVGNTKA